MSWALLADENVFSIVFKEIAGVHMAESLESMLYRHAKPQDIILIGDGMGAQMVGIAASELSKMPGQVIGKNTYVQILKNFSFTV